MKICNKCGTAERYADGHCIFCAKERSRAQHKNSDPAINRERSKAYARLNPEIIKAISKRTYEKNKEKRLAYAAKYHKDNLVKSREQSTEWQKNNKARHNEFVATWRENNKEAARVNRENYRARKKSRGRLTRGISDRLFALQKGKCACCGAALGDDYHLDHIMPFALGGSNVDGNVQLLKASCNLEKHAKHPIDFMQSRGFLL